MTTARDELKVVRGGGHGLPEANQTAHAVGIRLDRTVRRQRHVVGARPTCGGPVEWHALGGGAGGGDYTLCGVSVDGDQFALVQGNNRITCRECRATWLAARMVQAVDFAA